MDFDEMNAMPEMEIVLLASRGADVRYRVLQLAFEPF